MSTSDPVTKDDKRISRKKFLKGVALAGGVGALGITLPASMIRPALATGTTDVAPASYIVENNSGTITAYHCNTGSIDYSGTDAATVIQSAINNLAANRTWKEKIVIKGSFTINSPGLTVPSYVSIEIQGKLTMGSSANTAIFQNSDHTNGNTDIDIVGGIIDGNGSTQTNYGQAILFQNVSRFKLHGIRTIKCRGSAFDLRTCSDGDIVSCYVDCGSLTSTGGIGLGYASFRCRVIDCEVYSPTNLGIVCSGQAGPTHSNQIIGCYIFAPSSGTPLQSPIGISIDGGSYDNSIICCKVDGNTGADAINLEGGGAVPDSPHECSIIGCRVTGGGRISVAGKPYRYLAKNNMVSDCIVTGSNSHGFNIQYAQNTQVSNCTASNSGWCGFEVYYSNWTKISNCQSEFNQGDGFQVYSSSGCQLANCSAKDNNQVGTFGSSGFRIIDDGTLGCNGVLIGNCQGIDDQATPTQLYGVAIGALEGHTLIEGGNMTGNKNGAINGPLYPPVTNYAKNVMGFDLQ